MRHTRPGILATLLALGLAAQAQTWQRHLTFARLLAARGYFDLSERVIQRLLADKSVPENSEQRADLYRELGEHFAEMATQAARARGGLKNFVAYLDRAVNYLSKYANHPAIKRKKEAASEAFKVRIRTVWLRMTEAQAHQLIWADPETPKAEKEAEKKKAIEIYKTCIAQFQTAVAHKRNEQEKLKKQAPSKAKERKEWETRYNCVRTDHLRVRIYLNKARVALAKFLKQTGAKPQEWKPILDQACADYRKMLFDFTGAHGLLQINLEYAEALVMRGPEGQKEAIERLEDVWHARESFRSRMAIPCRARFLAAEIKASQGRHEDALDDLDEMLKWRTNKVWDPKRISAQAVCGILQRVEAGDPNTFDRNAMGKAYLLMADCYAALGAKAAKARKPQKDVRKNFAIAYTIALGVARAGVPMEPEYARKMETWRARARLPMSIEVLKKLAEEALRKRDFAKAARLYTRIIAQGNLDPRQAKAVWETIAKCYYAAGEYYRAYIVFTALSRRYPSPASAAYQTARYAVAAAQKQAETTKSDFDQRLVLRARRDAELLSAIGPGQATLEEAKNEREKGNYEAALKKLASIGKDSPAYPYALYEIALTHKKRFKKLPAAKQRLPAAKAILEAAIASFKNLVAYCRTTIPKIKGPQAADQRQRLTDLLGAAVAILTDTYLEDYLAQPQQVIALTDDLETACPSITKAYSYPLIIYNRMRAAYNLAHKATAEQLPPLLKILDGCWATIQGFKEFRYLANACKICAASYNLLATRLDEQAKKTDDPAAKASLAKRAAAARDRSLDFYIRLLELVPKQPIQTYRYVVYHLYHRRHDPKSADYRKVAELVPKAIELYETQKSAADDLLRLKATLGACLCRLAQYRDAITILEALDKPLEAAFQQRMANYQKQRALHDLYPDRYPLPKLPVRRGLHLEIRRWLARAYLLGVARSKYPVATTICAEDLRLYDRSKAEYWDLLYWLCESLRRQGKFEQVIRFVSRPVAATGGKMGDGIVEDQKGASRDFRDLLVKLRSDINALTDTKRKNQLMPFVEQYLKQLASG